MPTRVLLVDDDPLVRSGLSWLLSGSADLAVVGEASDGDEVQAAVASCQPDVVLMDLRMVRMDGLSATRALTAQPDAPHVIVLTTWDVDEAVIGALDAGASGFLLKTAGPDEIVQAIRSVVVGDAVLSKASMHQLIERLRQTTGGEAKRRAQALVAGITGREREVMIEVGRGASNDEIAAALYVSPATVKSHVGVLVQKLGVRNRVGIAVLAERAGLLAEVS